MIELFHFRDSVCSFKVRLCLAEKGLSWIDRHIDLLKFEHLRPEYLALNPNGVVPTLVHDGRPIIESTAINEYIDEVFPIPPLKPFDASARADMRVWVKYEDDVLHPAVRPGTFNLMLKSVVGRLTEDELAAMVAAHPKPEVAQDWLRIAKGPVDQAAVDAARSRLESALARLDERLSRHKWLAGSEFSLADIAIAPMVDRMEFLGLADVWSDKPHLEGWFERVKARPSYDRAAPALEHRLLGPLNCTI